MDGGGRSAAHPSRRWRPAETGALHTRPAGPQRRGPANSARREPGDIPHDGTMKTLQVVWLHIEQDFEASLLIFLEQLFLVEPSAALALRSLERRPKPPEVIADAPAQLEPSLSMRIKTVATHLGRAIRTACDCLQHPSVHADPCPPVSRLHISLFVLVDSCAPLSSLKAYAAPGPGIEQRGSMAVSGSGLQVRRSPVREANLDLKHTPQS